MASLFTDPVVDMASHRSRRILREQIHRGVLRPGERLVRRKLAQALGVSPVPITEALHQLEKEGLVEFEPLVGARVRSITMERIDNDLVLREALECQCSFLLAERLSSGTPEAVTQLTHLRTMARQLDAAMLPGRQDDASGMELHVEFHLHIAELTGYPALGVELRKVWSRYLMLLAWISGAIGPTPPNWHGRLVDAIASGDVERAVAETRYHVRRSPEDRAPWRASVMDALARLEANDWRLPASDRAGSPPISKPR